VSPTIWAIFLGICIAAIDLPSRPALAVRAFYNGNQIYTFCTTAGGQASCLAYVMGIADAMGDSNAVSGWTACIPDQVTGKQVADVAVQYFQRNPGIRHFAAPSLVAHALSEAFPCR
jgi:hypothetical protein